MTSNPGAWRSDQEERKMKVKKERRKGDEGGTGQRRKRR